MPLRKINSEAVPSKRGYLKNGLQYSLEFTEALVILRDGLKPKEAVLITKPSDNQRKFWARDFSARLRAELKSLGVNHIDVFRHGDNEVYITAR